MDKKYTSNGKPVRLLCVDAPGVFPIIGVTEGGAEFWTREGKYLPTDGSSPYDLVEVKPKIVVERWINITQFEGNPTISVEMFSSQEEALITRYLSRRKVLARAIPFRWEGEEP
jgi:hypothetical protein